MRTLYLRRGNYGKTQPTILRSVTVGAALAMLECLRDLSARWHSSLRAELGPTALETAWTLFSQEDAQNALAAARLAQYCGAWVVGNRGGKIQIISRLVGPHLTYAWLLLRRKKRETER